VRILLPLLAVAALGACGGEKPVRHDQAAVLDCLQRTNSTLLVRSVDGIALAFMSADGVSAIEPVYALFGSDRPANRAAYRARAAVPSAGRTLMVWRRRRPVAPAAGAHRIRRRCQGRPDRDR
jgi:hypothetical protein